MDGLIPFLIHAMKSHHHHHHLRSFNSFSEGSTRSYHPLVGGVDGSSVNGGSSHRRTRSDFQPPSTAGFLDHRSSTAALDHNSTAGVVAGGGGGGAHKFAGNGGRGQRPKETVANSYAVGR
ncbi:hypothetical protein LINGRAHAP2_LOCUS22811 [Linum grandiflorum]